MNRRSFYFPETEEPTDAATVAELWQFLDELGEAAKRSDTRTRKHMSDIRSGARAVLRALRLPPDTEWTMTTIDDWCDTFDSIAKEAGMASTTPSTYRTRLRTAARMLHARHDAPATDVGAGIDPPPSTLRDLKLLAAAWHTTPGDAVTRLVEFYLTANPAPPAPAPTGKRQR